VSVLSTSQLYMSQIFIVPSSLQVANFRSVGPTLMPLTDSRCAESSLSGCGVIGGGCGCGCGWLVGWWWLNGWVVVVVWLVGWGLMLACVRQDVRRWGLRVKLRCSKRRWRTDCWTYDLPPGL